MNHRVVEVESCAVYDGKLYFNANRTLPDGGKDCDCVAWTALPPAPVIEKPDENPAQDALVAKINAAAGSSVVITLTEDMTITSPISIPASTVVELEDGRQGRHAYPRRKAHGVALQRPRWLHPEDHRQR